MNDNKEKEMPSDEKKEEQEEKAKKAYKSEEKPMDKSMITETDLVKSCDALEKLTKSGPAARKQELLTKAIAGKLEETEVAELTKSLQGSSDTALSEEVAKAMNGEGNEKLQKSIDVSDYIGGMHKALTENLTAVARAFEKSEAKHDEETHVLAKALSDVTKATIQTARMLKSIQEKMGILAQQPARGPKAVSTQELAKSQASAISGVPTSDRLSPNDVLDTLELMFHKSLEASADGITVSGEKYEEAISKFEQTRDIHPALLREVVSFRARAGR